MSRVIYNPEDLTKQTNLLSLAKFPHEIFPKHTFQATNENFCQFYFKNQPFTSLLPIPVTCGKVVSELSFNDDPGIDLVYRKKKWIKNVGDFKQFYQKSKHIKKVQIKDLDSIIETGEVPKVVIDFFHLLSQDPDKYFDGSYNWYFTSGILNVIKRNDETLLLRCLEDKIGYDKSFIILPLREKNNTWVQAQKKNLTSVIVRGDGPIYTIDSTVVNYDIFTCTRQRNDCTFFNIVPTDSGYNSTVLKKLNSDVPFTSVCLLKNKYGKFCTADANRTIKVWDLNAPVCAEECVLSGVYGGLGSSCDNWSEIKYVNENELLFADRCSLNLIDTRQEIKDQSSDLGLNNYLEKCDKLSAICPSCVSENYFYVGTYHSLLLFDKRFTGKSVLQKWTHMMKSTPLLIKTELVSTYEELICLSSQLANEKCFVTSNCGNMSDINLVLPKKLLTLENSLHKSKENEKCLNPFSLVSKRMNFSTTGLCLVGKNNNVTVFYQNSLGDVFSQIISEDNIDNTENVVSRMSRWEKKILKNLRPRNFPVTSTVSLDYLFKNDTEFCETRKRKTKAANKIEKPKLESWQRDLSELQSYKDILGASVLDSWGYCSEKIGDEVIPNQGLHLPSTSERVSEWLKDVDENAILGSQSSRVGFISQQIELSLTRNVTTNLSRVTELDSVFNDSIFQPSKKRRTISGF